MTANSLSESGVILGSGLDIVQEARGAGMSSFYSASALLSFGTLSVRGAFYRFCNRVLVCDADATSRPWYPIFSQGLEGVLGVNVPVVPLELDKIAAGGVSRSTRRVEAMIANDMMR